MEVSSHSSCTSFPAAKHADTVIEGHPIAGIQMEISEARQIFRTGDAAAVFYNVFLCLDFFNGADIAEKIFIVDLLVILRFFAEGFFLTAIAAKHHIDQKAQNRDEKQHQKPCPCAGWVPAFKKDDKTGKQHICNEHSQPEYRSPE